MASVESIEDAKKAHAMGWRTFRVLQGVPAKKRRKGTPEQNAAMKAAAIAVAKSLLMPGEILCPNYTVDVQCSDCGLCDGANGKKSIAIPAH